MVNSLPDDSLIPIIIFAVTCSLTYLMPVALSISVMFSRMALISSRVISGRGSLIAGFLLLSIIILSTFGTGDGIAWNGDEAAW